MIHNLWTGKESIWICAHKEKEPNQTCEFYHDCNMKIHGDGFYNNREYNICLIWSYTAPTNCPFREEAESQLKEKAHGAN